MTRWSRAPREPLPPAPGSILPGVPLAPVGGTAVLQGCEGDPLAEPECTLAAQQARARQSLPVRIVVANQPVNAEQAPAEAEVSTATDVMTPSVDQSHGAALAGAAARPATEPATATAKAPHASQRVAGSSGPHPGPKPCTEGDVFSAGPWPDANSRGWPKVIPPWGQPPRGFGGSEARVAMVMKDGSRVLPSADQARQMLGLVGSLGS